ncbi:MAG: hypothetical protein AB1352_05050 [Patescibacteria group bacterium]
MLSGTCSLNNNQEARECQRAEVERRIKLLDRDAEHGGVPERIAVMEMVSEQLRYPRVSAFIRVYEHPEVSPQLRHL